MSAQSVETRLAVVEHEQHAIASRLDRELATKADVAGVRAELKAEIATTKSTLVAWVIATPAIYMGIIYAGLRLLEWLRAAGYVS